MFGRLLWKLLRSNRGRLAVALVAVISGATVISALLNVQFDISRKLSQEFSSLGPNLMIAPKGGALPSVGATPPTLMDEAAVHQAITKQAREPGLLGAEPFLYVVAQVNGAPVVVAGTDLSAAGLINPTWRFETGVSPYEPDTRSYVGKYCFVGRNAARQFNVVLHQPLELDYLGRTAILTVEGILDSGAVEDNQVLTDLATVQNLAGISGQIEVEQIRVTGTSQQIAAYASALAASLPEYDVKPIRQVTDAEGNLLNRTRLLIFSMILLILILTALCVLATMAALAMERRADVGLMKALGGTISRIVGLFLAEVGVLGAAGGLIGCLAGVALAQWMGHRVFGTSITPRWEIFPITIAMMIVVSMAGALPLRRLGKIKPAVILRGE
jgi:putative ABC transport system permease protein